MLREDDETGQGFDEVVEDVIDLEEYALAKKRPPRAKRYRIRIDRERYVVEVPSMAGANCCGLLGKCLPSSGCSLKNCTVAR